MKCNFTKKQFLFKLQGTLKTWIISYLKILIAKIFVQTSVDFLNENQSVFFTTLYLLLILIIEDLLNHKTHLNKPISEEEETSSSSNADTQRIESFEELMLKKRRLEESSRRDAMQNEKIQKSPSQLADFYLNLVSTRPSNCNSLEFWKNATLDFDPLVPLALDFAAIPSMVSIYDFFSTLGIQKLTNSDIQFFTIRLMIYMNKHILLD